MIFHLAIVTVAWRLCAAQTFQAYLSLTNDVVAELSDYDVVFISSKDYPANSKAEIRFPQQILIADTNDFPCEAQSSLDDDLTCRAAGNTVWVENGMKSASSANRLFKVRFKDIRNPGSNACTQSLQLKVTDDTETTTLDQKTIGMQICAAVGSLNTARINVGPAVSGGSDVVGEACVWELEIEPTHGIPADGQVIVRFPLWTASFGITDPNDSDAQHYPTTTTPECKGASGDTKAAGVSCTYAQATQQLVISSLFTEVTDAAFRVTIASVYNPPNAEPAEGFMIQTTDGSGNAIDEQPSPISVQVTTPGAITDITLTPTDTTVDSLTVYELRFTAANPVAENYKIEIDFPVDFDIERLSFIDGSYQIKDDVDLLFSKDIAERKITINDGYSSGVGGENFYYGPRNVLVGMGLSQIRNPGSTKPVGVTQISTLFNGRVVDTGTGADGFSAEPGSLASPASGAYVSPAVPFVSEITTYTFTFDTQHTVPVGGVVSVEFPDEVVPEARSSGPCVKVWSGLDSAASCEVISGPPATLVITNGFVSALKAPATIQFELDRVKNPPTTEPTQSFKLLTHSDNTRQHRIDETLSGVTITPEPNPLASVQITPTSGITGAVTTYTFSIVTSNTVPANGYLTVALPDKVRVVDIANAQTNCLPLAGFTTGLFNCEVTEVSIRVNGGFDVPFSGGGTLRFEITSVQNPPSTARFGSFTVTTFTPGGYKIDELAQGVYVKPDTANQLRSVKVSAGSLVNGERTAYTFEIMCQNETPDGAQVEVWPPSEVEFAFSPTCAAAGANVTGVTCAYKTGGVVSAKLALTSSSVPSGGTLAFTINNTRNPQSTEPSGTFKVYTFDSYGFSIDHLESGITVATTTPGAITQVSVSPEISRISTVTKYSITYTPINPHPVGTELEIEIPAGFEVGPGAACEAVSGKGLNAATMNCAKTDRTVAVTGGFTADISPPSEIALTITDVTNPDTSTAVLGPWIVRSKLGTYLIDETNDTSPGLMSSFSCNVPCFACTPTPDTCTSCDTGGATPYLYSDTCNASCQPGFLDVGGHTCEPCSQPCTTCKGSKETCTGCASPTPFLYNSTCNSRCQDTYYDAGGGTCQPCRNPCATCSTETTCTSCGVKNSAPDNGRQTYLKGASCVADCGSGFYTNPDTRQCDQCKVGCAECAGGKDVCTSCPTDVYLESGSCVADCTDNGTYVKDDARKLCDPCEQSCATCAVSVANCTACKDANKLYKGTCFPACPTRTTYVVSECVDCTNGCLTCTGSTSTCLTCVDDRVLSGNQCLTECPDDGKSVLFGKICQPCDNACLTCEASLTNCTSCPDGRFLHNGECKAACPDGITIPTAKACTDCDRNCRTCAEDVATCKSCHTGLKLYANRCESSCPERTTIEQDGICLPCDPSCVECAATTSACTKCKPDQVLYQTFCLDRCPDGITIEQTDKTCQLCDANCVTCSGTVFQCTTCPTQRYLYLETCYTECPSGFTPVNGVCTKNPDPVDCNTGCTAQHLQNDVCDIPCNVAACQFDNGFCAEDPKTCDPGQYLDAAVCRACVSPCKTCDTRIACSSCVDGFRLYVNTCFAVCPDGSVAAGDAGCISCDTSCATCANTQTTCTSCANDKLLYAGKCLNTCPANTTVTIGSQCYDCNLNCLTCEITADHCTSCAEGTYLYNSVCLSNCPDKHTTSAENVCLPCHPDCAQCSGTPSTCTACDGSRFLHNSQCVTTCPEGTTIPRANECAPCSPNCVTCTVYTDMCTKCGQGRKLYPAPAGACLAECPEGFADDQGVCVKIPPPELCAPGCTADLLANTSCDSACNTASCTYDNGFCEGDTECPTGQFRDGTACTNCLHPCSTCKTATICQSCRDAVDIEGNPTVKLLLSDGACIPVCLSGWFQEGLVCTKCSTSCKECAQSTDNCIECPDGNYLQNGSCVNDCPAGVTVKLGAICEPCSVDCATCQDAVDFCLTCPPEKYFYKNQCYQRCPDGSTTTVATGFNCQQCSSNCRTCANSVTTCVTCNPEPAPHLLLDASCVSECPEKSTVLLGDTCVRCEAQCRECSGVASFCTLCTDSGRLAQSGSCVESCIVGYEANLGRCEQQCNPGCTADLLANTRCDAVCNTEACNKDNQLCATPVDCPVGQYRDGLTCQPCESPCNLCTSKVTCTSCRTVDGGQRLLYNGSCATTKCPAKTWQDGVTCKDCHSSCADCSSDTETHCTRCSGGTSLYNGQCQIGCPVSETVDIGNVCTPCNVNCKTCSGSINTCTTCHSGTSLNPLTDMCELDCPSGYTTTPTSNQVCLQCSPNCRTCLGEITTCTSCTDLALHNGQCVQTCPSGFVRTDAHPEICSPCVSPCAECQTTQTTCTSCVAGKSLNASNICAEPATCPDGKTTTADSENVCIDCTDDCRTCVNATRTCTGCFPGRFLTQGRCDLCSDSCLTCSGGSTLCTSCEPGKVLQGSTCVACSPPCKTCTETAVKCTSCTDDLILTNHACVACDPTCLTCSNETATGCTSCQSPRVYYAGTCAACDPSCKACNGPGKTDCIECDPGMVRLAGECVRCDVSCLSCNGSGDANCLSCVEGKTLIAGQCVRCHGSCLTCRGNTDTDCVTCPTDRVINNTTGQCEACYMECLTCVGPASNNCQTCEPGKSLIGGQCITCDNTCETCVGPTDSECASCITGRTLNVGVCVLCHATCETCFGSGAANCLTCPPGKSLINDQCIECASTCKQCTGELSDECAECYPKFVLKSNSCLPCHETCQVCSGTGASECLECVEPM